jgi:hypothetical protein
MQFYLSWASVMWVSVKTTYRYDFPCTTNDYLLHGGCNSVYIMVCLYTHFLYIHKLIVSSNLLLRSVYKYEFNYFCFSWVCHLPEFLSISTVWWQTRLLILTTAVQEPVSSSGIHIWLCVWLEHVKICKWFM